MKKTFLALSIIFLFGSVCLAGDFQDVGQNNSQLKQDMISTGFDNQSIQGMDKQMDNKFGAALNAQDDAAVEAPYSPEGSGSRLSEEIIQNANTSEGKTIWQSSGNDYNGEETPIDKAYSDILNQQE